MLINTSNFIFDIPKLNPLSREYINYWKQQKIYDIEGYWDGGIWMPPSLFFYGNHGTIKLNKGNSNVKSYGRPLIRDIEWNTFRYYTVARGFSGFENDLYYSCNNILLDYELFDAQQFSTTYPQLIAPDGMPKIYEPPVDYIAKHHNSNLGRPLYENPALNLMMLGARNFGKSYMVGTGIILHNFLFDGVFSYEDSKKDDVSTEVMVGAYESKYTNLLLEKTKDALERLPGEVELNNKVYNAPLSRRYKGSWDKDIVYTYKKKIGGEWKNKGTKTNIKNRTFGDNAYAGIGSRPTIFIVEEVGLCRNIKDIHAAMKDAQRDGLKKFATSIYLGTGGEMDLGAAAASEIFYNPEQYECLHFPDIYENRGRISYFIPAYMARQEFKDEFGFTVIDKAKKAIEAIRDKLKTRSSSDALNKEIINNPIVPSEMFITKSSNLFPSVELANRLSFIEANNLYDKIAKKVELYFDPESEYNGVNYQIDTAHKLRPIDRFPLDDSHSDRDGAVVIYELPQLINGSVPDSTYVIGVDPYKDDSIRGESLAAVYVVKTSKHFDKIGHDEIVATYIGRPYMGRDAVNEIIYKLSMFYGNAKVYFENSVGNVKDYFERIKRLDLLARKPHTVFNKKASFESSPIVEYGYPMSNERIKYEALQYVRSWLLEVRESSEDKIVRNLDLILDKGLIQELILFSMDGNFDRVMGFAGAIIGLNEISNVTKEAAYSNENPLDTEFKNLLVNNSKIFKHEKFPKTANPLF